MNSQSLAWHDLALVRLAPSIFLVLLAVQSEGAVLKAEYRFNGDLQSSIAGAPALVPVDPLGTNVFKTDIVGGISKSVYAWNGNMTPVSEQSGFTLDTTGLVATNSYSVQMVFQLTQRPSAWRRLVDVEGRQSDDGFYVDPQNHLAVYPIISSVTPFTNGIYEDVLLTVGGGRVKAYLNGVLQFDGSSTLMNINLNNTGEKLGFFLDNVVGGGQGEYSRGSIALLRLYSGVITPVAPVLSIVSTATNSVVVSWASPSTGWGLQCSTNLATTNWPAFTGIIHDDGTNRSAVITPPIGNMYFRLSNP